MTDKTCHRFAACGMALFVASLALAQPVKKAPEEDPFDKPHWGDREETWADVLVPDSGPGQEVRLETGDKRGAEMLQRLEALQPRTRLPWPALPAQVARHLTQELHKQGHPGSVKLRLNAGLGGDAGAWRTLVLYYGTPAPRLQQALATGTLGQIAAALAESLQGRLIPCADGLLVVELQLSPARLDNPHGAPPDLAALQQEFADVFCAPVGVPPPLTADEKQQTARLPEQLGSLRPAVPLPCPVLLPQVIRHLNAEFARQHVPCSLAVEFEPQKMMDPASSLEGMCYQDSLSDERFEKVLRSGTLQEIIDALAFPDWDVVGPGVDGRMVLRRRVSRDE